MSAPATPENRRANGNTCPGAPARKAPESRLDVVTIAPMVLDFDEIPASRCVTPRRPIREIEVPNAPLRPIQPAAVMEQADLQVPVCLSPPRIARGEERSCPGAPARRARQNTDIDFSDPEAKAPSPKRARLEK